MRTKRMLPIALLVLVSAFFCPAGIAINQIPAIQTHSLEGLHVSFRPPQEKLMMMLFWDTSSWRADQTAAWSLDVYRQFHDKGLEIIGICTDSLEDEVMEFSERWRIPWPQVPNAEIAEMKRTEQFGIIKTPANLILDSRGKVLAQNVKQEQAYEIITRLLNLEDNPSGSTAPTIRLTKRDWGAEQATGEPDTPEAGDFATAWSPLTSGDRNEWLLLHYETPVQPKQVKIFETLNPGAVFKIGALMPNGQEATLWTGTDPTSAAQDQGISEIPITADFKTDTLKIYLDSKKTGGCNGIDAVGLADASGKTHWAIDAQASSSFADTIQFNDEDKGYLFPTHRTLVSLNDLTGSDKAVNEMKQCAKNCSPGRTKSFRFHIRAFIDGTSVLTVHRNTARWYHPEPVLEGMQSDEIFPTYLNGTEWLPQWANNTQSGWSSIQTNLYPSLPMQAVRVSMKNPKVEATNCGCEMNKDTFGFSGMIGQAPKGAIYILQQPTAENDYVLAIAFDDFGLGGSNIYDCYVNIRIADQEITSPLAQAKPAEIITN